ncbi:unnamed protein product [Victoria cruziana]
MRSSDRKRKRGNRTRKLSHDDPAHDDAFLKRRRQASSSTLSLCLNPDVKALSSSFLQKYHAGYQEQMSRWPEQPVDSIIKWLKGHSPSLVVADFGCGEARIAKSVKNVVFSIDLVSNDPSIIACDMSKTPLASSSVDVAIFCLSLMGTNFPSYLEEAHRVLKPSGWLLIAEVKSRFDSKNGGADPNIFSKCVHKLGFNTVSKDFSNKMFVLIMFRKMETSTSRKNIQWPKLKPCLYKRRVLNWQSARPFSWHSC